ncbi:hypothetical protein FP2506_16829 [Fulvimarina pelagi HTCC2506]|uniref:Uncharacterized protein n=1 Tax=Fulvimarina pelagi HTCC2506 TaxID=314231 RepID=Q0G2R4_9HYPH|nr:hypothetical protein FP2506_16829 [Fulvimarina pelagi HTCC2506]
MEAGKADYPVFGSAVFRGGDAVIDGRRER